MKIPPLGIALALGGLACQEPASAPERTVFTPPTFSEAVIDSANASSPFIVSEGGSGIHVVYWAEGLPDYTPLPWAYAECAGSCDVSGNWNAAPMTHDVYSPLSAVLSGGRIHVAYTGFTRLRYGTCLAGCTMSAQWQMVDVDTTSGALQSASITADSSGTLHVVYTGSDSTGANLQYARCSTACDVPANWARAKIDTGARFFDPEGLKTDRAGRLHLVAIERNDSTQRYTARYASCDSSCTNPASWHFTKIDSGPLSTLSNPRFAIGPSNSIDVVFSVDTLIRYVHCSASCNGSAHWTAATIAPGLFPQVEGDATGKLVMIATRGTGIQYAECTSSCQKPLQWSSAPILQNEFVHSVRLALDASDKPLIAYAAYVGSQDELRIAVAQ